ncbi:MAG: outer membrane lipoprotein carrier protein LolA [Candidatus Rokuibacteriota bacterium]|nr:MAG: outer membrane lipoprotein carrier protein LolA [Candidatus Rokubacteria bacterium]
MRNALTLVVVCLSLGVASAVPAQTLEDVVRDLETAYGRMADLRAEFTQTAFNKSLNQTIPAQGTVYLKKGGKLRWEYTEPTPQEIVSDGKKLWVYTPSLNQVNVGDAPEALAGPAGSFLAGLGRLRAEFSVRFLNPAQPTDAEGNWVLDLEPKQPLPTLARLILSVDAKTWAVRKAVVYDQFENTVTMRLTKVAINSSLPDRLFTFVVPKGVATVPLR